MTSESEFVDVFTLSRTLWLPGSSQPLFLKVSVAIPLSCPVNTEPIPFSNNYLLSLLRRPEGLWSSHSMHCAEILQTGSKVHHSPTSRQARDQHQAQMGVTPRSLAVKALWHCGNSPQGVRESVEDEACSPS